MQRSSRRSKPGAIAELGTDSEPGAVAPEPIWESGDAMPVPGPAAELAPEPVWSDEPDRKPRRIPDWEPEPELKTAPETTLWKHDIHTTDRDGPVFARMRLRRGRSRPSRALITTVVLVGIFLAFVAVAVIVYSRHHSTNTAAGPPAVSTRAATFAPGASGIETATATADSATTATRQKIYSLSGFPTVAKVEAVINPYISSLQTYGAFLAGNNAPASAKAMAASTGKQVSGDIKYLSTIHGLPSLQLGAYLNRFGAVSTQLQTTLVAFDRELGRTTS